MVFLQFVRSENKEENRTVFDKISGLILTQINVPLKPRCIDTAM